MKNIILSPKEVEELCIWPANPKRYTDYAEMSYSQGYWLKKFFYYPHVFDLYVTLQHGIYFNENDIDLNDIMQDTNYFFSFNKIKNIYKKNIVVGSPFILYKEKFNIKKEKNRIGTLVFPYHSTPTHDPWSLNKLQKYIYKLKKLPKKFHPIVVCIYFRDVHKGYHKIFYENGLNITTIGHGSRYDFIPRFYNILKKFKYVTSNQIGSYTFYALDLGIPFFLYGNNKQNENNLNTYFLKPQDIITKEQKQLIKKYLSYNRNNKFYVTFILYKEWIKFQFKLIKRKFLKIFLEYFFQPSKYLYLGKIESHKKRYIEYLYQKNKNIFICFSKDEFKNLIKNEKFYKQTPKLIYINLNLNNNENEEICSKNLFQNLFENITEKDIIIIYKTPLIKKVLIKFFKKDYIIKHIFEDLIIVKKVNSC
jgi:hypothetical protein